MKLKKINEELQQALIENGLTEANAMQKETFSTLKSGSDCIIIAPKGSGKSTTIVLNVIQRLADATEESPRALQEKIEAIGVNVVVKNNIQSARLGGFGNLDLAVELFVQETEFSKVNPVIEEFRMSI